MTSQNPTKDQHFVPRLYLKNFASEDSHLEVLNIKEKRLGKRRPYQGLGYAHFYYAAKTGISDELSQHVEAWLGSIEDFISKQLPRIIAEILGNGRIQDDDRYVLSVLMSMLWLRTPGMRTQLKESEEGIAKEIEKLHGSKNAEHFKSEDNIQHLKLMVNSTGLDGPGFANMFFNMKWKVYIARGTEFFITSDSPVVEKWLPPKGIYGASFLERDKYFPLTPNILLELTYPRGTAKIKRETLYEADNYVIKSLNIIIASGADSFVYSGNKEPLEKLLAGRENPGRLEREYIEKYEIPWAEYRERMGK